MPYRVVPFEGSSRHHTALNGDLLVSILQHPDTPTAINPLLVASGQVPASLPTVLLSVGGNLSVNHVGWDPIDDVIILQDPVSSDILMTYVDFTFEFRDALIFMSKDHFKSNSAYTIPYSDIKRRVLDFMGDWIAHNPWALISAIVTGRYRNVLRPGASIGPEYGKYAISGFTMQSYMESLGKMSSSKSAYLRNAGDNDPFAEGHLEYHLDPTETDDSLWGVRVVGKVALRYKTGRTPIAIVRFARPLKDFDAKRYIVQDDHGMPTFPDGSIPGDNLGPVGPSNPDPIDPDPDPKPDPIVDPDPVTPPVILLSDKKVILNNCLTGVSNFIHRTTSQTKDSYLTSANSWRDDSSVRGIFNFWDDISNAEVGEYYTFDTNGVQVVPADSTGDADESAIAFLCETVRQTSAFTAKFNESVSSWLGEKLYDLGAEATVDLLETFRGFVYGNILTKVSGGIPSWSALPASLPKTLRQFTTRSADGEVQSIAMDGADQGFRWGVDSSYFSDLAIGWSDANFPSHVDMVSALNQFGKPEFLAWGRFFCEWPLFISKSVTSGIKLTNMQSLTWANYVAYLGFTPDATNTVSWTMGTSINSYP